MQRGKFFSRHPIIHRPTHTKNRTPTGGVSSLFKDPPKADSPLPFPDSGIVLREFGGWQPSLYGRSLGTAHLLEKLPDLFDRTNSSPIILVREAVPEFLYLVVPDLVAIHAIFVVVGGGSI